MRGARALIAIAVHGILELLEQRGQRQYSGEPVTQLEHALQTATLAQESAAGDELLVAALLHDLGHLLTEHEGTPTERGLDDRHQFTALPVLRKLFGERVLQPIRLHVDAKRYLCATRPGYLEGLSADSLRSLELQGGAFSAAQAARFLARPFAAEAVQLRVWDDAAKIGGKPTRPLLDFAAALERTALG